MKTTLRRTAAFLSGLGAITVSQGEVLDTLREYGNAATADATSGAGIARGFTNPAAGEYTITAGGTDIWGNSDHGTFIHDADVVQSGDFSAVVRVSSIGEPGEFIPGEWGRTGIMARTDPAAANSANVAHMRKSGGGNPFTTQQWRDTAGGGTARAGSEHGNGAANTANGDVDSTPLWVALHRVDDTYYTTWADDAGGSPGTWSDSREHLASAATAGDVYVGLAHQNHAAGGANPNGVMTSTATFDSFEVGAFDPDLGDFPILPNCSVAFNGLNVELSAFGNEVGTATPVDVDWEVTYIGPEEYVQGELRVDLFMQNNGGNLGAFETMVAGDPDGTTYINTIRWAASNYVETNPGGVNLFANAVGGGAFTGNQESYGAHITGEIFIPSDASRDGVESIRFHDGVDDYCLLSINNVVLIDDNNWSNLAGTGNNGGAQATLDVSDPMFDNGAWVPFRMGMWEGGGGDDCVLQWDALDRTGVDDVTGGTDAVLGSYNPSNLGDAIQVAFDHDRSDEIPSANFRVIKGGIVEIDSGSGQPDGETLPTTLTSEMTELQITIDGALVKTVPVLPSFGSAAFTDYREFTLTLEDVGTGGTRDVDPSTLQVFYTGEVLPNEDGTGFVVNPITDMDVTGSVTISKMGTTTSIVDSFPGATPVPYTSHTYRVTGETTPATGSIPFEFEATVDSFPFLEELQPPGDPIPNATVGWDVQEFDAIATLGGNLGGNPQNFRDAQYVIRNAASADAQMQQPFINHTDPETNANSGDWIPDLPILRDTMADDQQYVTYARTVVSIANEDVGDYTFRIRGDDGYGLRIPGANFVSAAGNANNMVHPAGAFFPAGTGNSDAFIVVNFPTADDYTVEFFAWEGGGGSYQEISWAPGAFTSLGQSIDWSLLGNTDGYVATTVWGDIPEVVVPPLPTGDGGWGVHFWYDAQVGNLPAPLNFLRGLDGGGSTFSSEFIGEVPFLDHKDDENGGVHLFPNDLPFPGDPLNPGDTNNIALLAHGRLVAPVDGDYSIQIRSDDGFLFRFLDPSVQFDGLDSGTNGQLHPSALNEIFHPTGTGDTNTRAWLNLAAGEYDVHFVWWEGGGGSSVEISAAPGIVPANSVPPYELLTGTPSATNLYLGANVPAPFTITEIVRDDVAEEFSVTFNSSDGADYAVDLSLDLNTGAWLEATDLPGEGESTTFTATYAELRGVLGIPPGDPLPDTLLARVRDIALQGDPNP